MQGSEIEIDPDYGIFINDTDIPNEKIEEALRQQAPEIAAIRKWALSNTSSTRSRKGTIFDRDKFLAPSNIFDSMRLAADAASTDDIVANVVETTEQLAFKKVAIECRDEDEQTFWSQLAIDINIEEVMREIWRELFILNQAYPVTMFGKKTFKVPGSRRKREFSVIAPLGVTLLDPLKVLPVGNFMFGQERLVYIADREEAAEFESIAENNSTDLIVNSIFEGGGPYQLSKTEERLLGELTGDIAFTGRCFLMKKENAWRITSTRPSYQRFANVRMESIFELLDLKHLLREMDRSVILGSTNAIILVKKGDKDEPARPQEIQQLAAQVQTAAKVPIIVGDHRISVEIITPKSDKTLSPERYNGLDSRITARLYQILNTGNYASGTATDDSLKLFKMIGSSMESRRDQIAQSIVQHVLMPTFNKNISFKSPPKIQFYPQQIALDFDPNIAQFMLDLRQNGELSRGTILSQVGVDQDDESYKRELEKRQYDEHFTPVNVAYSSPVGVQNNQDGTNPQDQGPNGGPPTPKQAGRKGGGNSNGGGRNPDSTKPNSP